MKNPSLICLIPARAGSKRVVGKNVRSLGGHPLMAYTVSVARESGIFNAIVVSTDSAEYAEVALRYGAEVPFLRPEEYAGDASPDIEWLNYTLQRLQNEERVYDCFCLLRPTSPFRTAQTIQRAWQLFLAEKGVDSLRAVEPCRQHPGKMWVVRGNRMYPLLPLTPADRPWHSCQTQSLPHVYVQNASLEIAWSRVVFETGTIAGHVFLPFFTDFPEGFDINSPQDWFYAQHLLERGEASLPPVEIIAGPTP